MSFGGIWMPFGSILESIRVIWEPSEARERPGSVSWFFGVPKGLPKGSKREVFFPKIVPKGGPGAETAIFFAKMRKCSKHRVARVQMALRTIQNRQKSVEEGQKLRKNRRKCKKNAFFQKVRKKGEKRGFWGSQKVGVSGVGIVDRRPGNSTIGLRNRGFSMGGVAKVRKCGFEARRKDEFHSSRD